MVVVKSLSEMNPAYSRESQVKSVPLPPLRDKGKSGYAEATARATNAQGQIVCEDCHKVIPKGKEERHHIRKRSQLGSNSADNLLVLCQEDHMYREAHGGKKKPKAKK